MIDLNQISLRLKNSAYALETTGLRLASGDTQVAMIAQANSNRDVANAIDEIIAKGGSVK